MRARCRVGSAFGTHTAGLVWDTGAGDGVPSVLRARALGTPRRPPRRPLRTRRRERASVAVSPPGMLTLAGRCGGEFPLWGGRHGDGGGRPPLLFRNERSQRLAEKNERMRVDEYYLHDGGQFVDLGQYLA